VYGKRTRGSFGRPPLYQRRTSTMAPQANGRPEKLPTKLMHTLASHKGPVHTAIFNSSRKFLLTGGQDRKIKLWNPFTANEMKEYSGHGYEVLGLAWYV
jgi:WD40 repeat protein